MIEQTGHQCTCGGSIEQGWDREDVLASCDNCDDPHPKVLMTEEQDVVTA